MIVKASNGTSSAVELYIVENKSQVRRIPSTVYRLRKLIRSQKAFPSIPPPYFHFCREWGPSKIFGTEAQHKPSITRAPFRNAHGSSSSTMSALWQLIVKWISSKPATKHGRNPHYCPTVKRVDSRRYC